MVIQDSDYVLYKKLAAFEIRECSAVLEKINAKCLKEISEYEKLKSKFLASDNYELLGENSRKFQAEKDNLIKILSVQDRIEKLLERSKVRLEFISAKLDSMGFYNQNVDKKEFSKLLSLEPKLITDEEINLNNYGENSTTYKFFAGQVLAFKNNELDFSLEFNQNLLLNTDQNFIHEIVQTFPYSVATIPDNCYMMPNIKNNILKECVLYVSEKLKTQSISKSNQELGGLIANVGKINSIAEYASELRNYLNVVVKQNIKKNAPELSDEADKYLRCNETSEFLPASKRRAVLANGLAGDIPKTEAEESEEIRKEQEKEAKEQISREEFLALMLADEDDLELENNEQDAAVLEAEERRLNEEKQQEDIELEFQNALKKNDSVD